MDRRFSTKLIDRVLRDLNAETGIRFDSERPHRRIAVFPLQHASERGQATDRVTLLPLHPRIFGLGAGELRITPIPGA
jgi:hypothetical protein